MSHTPPPHGLADDTPTSAERRTVRDSMGELSVPADALYGAQTQRAIDNFGLLGQPMPMAFIRALLQVKAAAAQANVSLKVLKPEQGAAIVAAAEGLLALPDHELAPHFPVDVFQTGSGTSTNMNANEVLARWSALRHGVELSPNDHVNASQSSNDTIPSSLHLSLALAVQDALLPALAHLRQTIKTKAERDGHHVKTGRTHLMDAMPVRLGQVLGGWAAQVDQAEQALAQQVPRLTQLAQGGTAVGTGVNTPAGFAAGFCQALSQRTGHRFTPAPNHFAAMGAQDAVVALSGQLKALAVAMTKVANDLRWMNSGPLAGLGEIELPALQPGSSIMPGKVNPVIPEAVAMCAAQVIGNDTTVTLAGQSGNFELNVMLPVMARNALESVQLLERSARLLADKAIAGFTVRADHMQAQLARNPILVTALNPLIGYLKAAEIAKLAYEQGRPILDVADEHTDLGRERLQALLDPTHLTGT